jgi:basic membrane protein A
VRIRRFLPWLTLALAAVSLAIVAGAFARGGSSAKGEAKTLKVGLVTDIGGLNDRGFNALAYKGLKEAQTKLKVQGRVLISKGPNDYIPNFTTLVKQGYDLIIGVGFLQTDAMDTIATKFPKSKFAQVDVDVTSLKHKPKNVQGILFKEQEVGYIVGVVATLLSRDERLPSKAGKVPFIASVGGIKIPPVDRFIAGYEFAAKKTEGTATVKHAYSQDFGDQAKCKEIAQNFYDQGADVVFQVAGGCGLGVIASSKEQGKWSIGVDADQNYIDPTHVATSALKKVDRGVYLTIASLVANKFKGGVNRAFGVKEGGVGAGKFSPKVPASVKAAAAKAALDIKSGKIKGIPVTVKG